MKQDYINILTLTYILSYPANGSKTIARGRVFAPVVKRIMAFNVTKSTTPTIDASASVKYSLFVSQLKARPSKISSYS